MRPLPLRVLVFLMSQPHLMATGTGLRLEDMGPATQYAEASLSIQEGILPGIPPTVHLGVFEPEEPLLVALRVHNDSDAPIALVDVDPGCGCTSADLPAGTIGEGSEALAFLFIDLSGRGGLHEQLVIYQVQTPSGESLLRVSLQCEVRSFASLTPQELRFHVYGDASVEQSMTQPLGLVLNPDAVSDEIAAWNIRTLGQPPAGVSLANGAGETHAISDRLQVSICPSELASLPTVEFEGIPSLPAEQVEVPLQYVLLP